MKAYDIEPQAKALGVVSGYIDSQYTKPGREASLPIPEYQVFIVWYAYVLGNWKALISSTLDDDMYYEVSFNRESNEIYLDGYSKLVNIVVPSLPREPGV